MTHRLNLRPGSARQLTESYLLPVLVILLALALNLYRLESKSLWHDEFGTLTLAGLDGNWIDALRNPLTVPTIPKAPLPFFVTRVFFMLGQTDFSVRIPSVLFATLTIPLVFALGKSLFGRQVGLLGALLLAVAPLQIRYAQEARMYAMLSFFSILSLYLFWRALRDGKGGWWLSFVAASGLNLYVQQFAFLPLGVMSLFGLGLCVWPRARTVFSFRCWHLLLAIAAIALMYVPMVPFFVEGLLSQEGFGGGSPEPTHGELRWSVASILGALRLFSGGNDLGLVAYALLFALAVVVVLFRWRATRHLAASGSPANLQASKEGWPGHERYALALAVMWVVLPTIIAMSIPAGHGVRIRYLIFALPVYLLVVALGLKELLEGLGSRLGGFRLAGWALVSAVVLGVVIAINAPTISSYYQETKQNWRDATWLVESSAQAGERVYVSRLHHRTGVLFYAQQWTGGPDLLTEESVRILPKDPTEELLPDGSERAWLIVPLREDYLPGGEFDRKMKPHFQILPPTVLDPSTIPRDSLLIAPISYRSLAVAEIVRYHPPSVRFWADDDSISKGNCTWLNWDTEYIREVYLDGDGVVGKDRRQVCPPVAARYVLEVIHIDGTVSQETLDIAVEP